MLAVLAGISLSVLAAGFFLTRRRRRYRAISATARSSSARDCGGRGLLTRSSTFGLGTEDGEIHQNIHRSSKHDTSETATHTIALVVTVIVVMPCTASFLPGMQSESRGVEDGFVSRLGVNGSGAVGGATLEDVDCERDSVVESERESISSNGSFHSTLESLEDTHVSYTCSDSKVSV